MSRSGPRGPWKAWQPEEDELLRFQAANGTPHRDLSVPGRTFMASRLRYRTLGLKCATVLSTGKLGSVRTRAAIRSPSIKDLHWAAGVFEGEGNSIYAASSERACVSQKDPELLYRFQKLFGGTVQAVKKGAMHCWVASGSRARGFLMTMYPLLTKRRQQQVRNTLTSGAS